MFIDQESLELASRGAKQVAVTALSFPSNDVNKFIVGSQECNAYQVRAPSPLSLSLSLSSACNGGCRASVMGVSQE